MSKQYKEFMSYLINEDKDNALLFILELLKNGTEITNIYKDFLIPSLSDYSCLNEDEEICIWKEHTRTSIIRTILEATYQYIIKKPKKYNNKSVIVVCPKEEYHEIGAIIATNYFSLVGFKSSYIGANTPTDDILSALKALKPNYIAISVTNYYNLVVTKKLTETIKKIYPNIKIILGGQAFNQASSLKQMNYDYHLDGYEDILKFSQEVIA